MKFKGCTSEKGISLIVLKFYILMHFNARAYYECDNENWRQDYLQGQNEEKNNFFCNYFLYYHNKY